MKRTELRNLYGKSFGRIIPEYSVISLIASFAVNSLIYWGAQLLMKDKYHYDFTSTLDNKVPFIKEWVAIYLVCYIFWIVNYILAAREGRERWFRFAFADMLSRLICGVFFVLLPTTNVRPIVTGDDIFSRMMNFIYQMDKPSNLFPSIHCLVSWYCFIAIRSSKKIPLWYKVFSCIFAILVFLSTQFTKQHYLIDVIGGVAIAELCYYIAYHTQVYIRIEKAFLRLNEIIFGGKAYDE